MGRYEEFLYGDGGVTILRQHITFRELALAIFCLVLTIVASSLCVLLILQKDKDTLTTKFENTTDVCISVECLSAAATIAFLSDGTVDPCENFYNYACGNWAQYEKEAALKPSEGERSIFTLMREENDRRVFQVLTKSNPNAPQFEKKVKDFYSSCIDDFANTKTGGSNFVSKVIRPALGWNVLGDWVEADYNPGVAMKKVHIDFWTDVLFRVTVAPDWYNFTQNTIQLGLGGLTLYWYEYNSVVPNARIINATKTFMYTVANLVIEDSGVSMSPNDRDQKARDFANDVYAFEDRLAHTIWYSAPSQNPHDHQNRVNISELHTIADYFPWEDILTTMFDTAKVNGQTKIVLLESDYLRNLNNLLKTLPNATRTLNNYFTWRLMQGYVTDLGWEYIHANREFYVARYGVPQFLGVPKYCFNLVEQHFSDALGALFIRDHLVTDDKATVDEIVTYLKQGLADRLKAADWMDEVTRALALEKEMEIKEKLGYPSWMLNNDILDGQLANVVIAANDYLGNLISIAAYDKERWNKRLIQGENRDDWRFKVYDTAGLYDNYWNELLIPAGILQFPVFGRRMPKYFNFGSLGANLAHELVHSVDEIGGYYLKNGTFFDWWTPNTTSKYNERRDCLEQLDIQAGPYLDPSSGAPRFVKINGTYAAREVIAETGAIRIAYYAYKDWVAKNGAERPAPGLKLTTEQTYFLAFAQTQCFVRRDSYSISRAEWQQIPEDQRVNIALAHTPEFGDAFKCQEGSKMRVKTQELCSVF